MNNKPKKNIQSGQQKAKPVRLLEKQGILAGIPKWAPIAVLVFTALLYSKALYNGFVPLDDDAYLVKNLDITHLNLHCIKAIFSSYYVCLYLPFTMLTYMLEFAWLGLHPMHFHFFDILFHLLNTWLVFKLVEKLSGKRITALFVSLLFAIHPMHVESVAWISERKDVLYTAFYLLSLLAYLRYMESGYKAKYYIFSILLFLASILSKPAAITLTVLLIGIDVYKGRKINAKSLWEKVPFLLLSLLFGVLVILSQNKGNAINDLANSFYIVDRIFLVLYSVAFYMIKFIAPFGLSAIHYYPVKHGGFLPWQYYASLPFLLCIAWLMIRRSVLRKDIIFGLFFFLVTLSVMLQLVPVGYSITNERYTYVPYIGLLFIAGQWISRVNKKFYIAIIVCATLFAGTFTYQAWDRMGVWKNGKTLYSDVILKYPECYSTYWLRGMYKNSIGDVQGAFLDFDKAIELNPKFLDGYNVRGMYRAQTGDIAGAMSDLDKAISLSPEGAALYDNRGRLKLMTRDYNGALVDLSHSIKLDSSFNSLYYNRGMARLNLKDTTGACKDWQKALKMGNEEAAKLINQYCNGYK